ncbi:MAG: zf-HC2 domain-containing protein [Elusimicrobiota bacterium]|jgi:anti-sigma factor RsiW
MDHLQAQELLSDFRDGELSARQDADMRLHLAACPECRQALETLAELSGAMFAPIPEDEQRTRRLVAGVLRKLRSERFSQERQDTALPPWFVPALGFSFATLLLSFLPLAAERIGSAPSSVLEGLADNGVKNLFASTKTPTIEETLQSLLEER